MIDNIVFFWGVGIMPERVEESVEFCVFFFD